MEMLKLLNSHTYHKTLYPDKVIKYWDIENNATIRDIGIFISPHTYKALLTIETISP